MITETEELSTTTSSSVDRMPKVSTIQAIGLVQVLLPEQSTETVIWHLKLSCCGGKFGFTAAATRTAAAMALFQMQMQQNDN